MPTASTASARHLRRSQTRSEAILWRALRNRQLGGWKFRRQVPRGPYVVDFLCPEAELVVEIDGDTHGRGHELAHDARRTAYLESQGLRVLRLTNQGIYESLDGACLTILAALERSRLAPATRGRGQGEGEGASAPQEILLAVSSTSER